MKELILGGARSGKSRLAEEIAAGSGFSVVYIATATAAADEEMRARIEAHRARRPAAWTTMETPVELAKTLAAHAGEDRLLLIDCLTLWLTNLLLLEDENRFIEERTSLLDIVPSLPGHLVLVSNETGSGVVPMGALSRRFVDEAGWLHQALAQVCDRVILAVAGLPQVLKGPPL